MKKIIGALMLVCAIATCHAQGSLTLNDINVRDPFIYADPVSKTYYMYTSRNDESAASINGDSRGGVAIYKSKDLKHWGEPKQVLVLPEDNWVSGHIWAPEMHCYNGKYYLFATVNTNIQWSEGLTYRATQIFWSDSPEGPFRAFPDKMPVVSLDEMTLDGTLWVENGQPYMVYCHEWLQVDDGEVRYIPLKDDLSAASGPSRLLFCGSAAKWVKRDYKNGAYITDGCFLYRTKKGKLLMIWSSFTERGYAVGLAQSVTGKIVGPWKQFDKPLFDQDGGHAMLFKDFKGKLHMALHAPNSTGGQERAHILDVEETEDGLIRIVK